MANSTQTIVLETTDALDLGGHTTKGPVLQRVVNLINGLRSGAKRGVSAQVFANGAALLPAVAHIKLVSWATGEVIEINGVPFTSTAAAIVAGNDEVLNTGADAADAALLSTAINSCTKAGVFGIVKAVNPLKDILTPSTAIAGNNFKVTLADGSTHTFTGIAAAVTVGTNYFDTRTSNAACATSITAQVNGYAAFAGKVRALDGTTIVTFRSLDGSTFTLLGTASTLAESGGGVVTVSAQQKGGLGNALSVKSLGLVGTTTCTVASAIATDTLVIGGTTLTGIVQNASATITPSTAVAGNTVTIGGNLFTAVAGAVVLGSTNFSIDTSDAATCTSLAAQVNAFAPFAGFITATASSTVVTLRAVTAGTAGNSITLASTAVRLAKSGTAFAGGIAVANNQFAVEAGATDTQVATDIVRCIGASTTALLRDYVRATSRAAVVHLWAKHPGLIGNQTTSASTGGTITVAAARLGGATIATHEGVQASGTVTITGGSGDYTVTINGVNASGTVSWSTSDTVTAALITAAINLGTNAAVRGVIEASSSSTVVTIKAVRGGISGNNITLACTGTGAVASVTRLASGAVPTTVVISNNVSPTTVSGATNMASGTGGAVAPVNFSL